MILLGGDATILLICMIGFYVTLWCSHINIGVILVHHGVLIFFYC